MIPVSDPIIAKNAKKYLLTCLTSGWVSSRGPFIERFERVFARFIGTKYAVATSSGTSALHLSLAALRIGPGDEVIVPTLTMIATALPIMYQGATPVLVDSEPGTGNIDVQKIKAKITRRTRAIIPVHLHGHPANMTAIMDLAKKHHLAVVEDAAEAHGAEFKGRKVGSFGDAGVFSFYGNKIITTGEGGMVTTNNKALADRMRSLRNLARTPGKHFLHQEVAFAYRLSNLQAALGLAQTEEADRFVDRKRAIAKKYNELLSGVSGIILPVERHGYKSVYWQYGIVFSGELMRNTVEKLLAKRGIETREFFVPLHRQPAFTKRGLFSKERYPVSEMLSARGLCLPSGLTLTDNEITYVCKNLVSSL